MTDGYTKAVNNELNRYCIEVSFNVKDRVNRILDIFTESYSEIAAANSSDMTIAACSEDMTTENAVRSLVEIKNTIGAYKTDRGYVDSIFVYFPKSKYVISNSSNFSDNYTDNFNDTEWISEYKKKEKLLNIRTVKTGNIKKTFFTVIKPVNSGGQNNLVAYNIDIDGFFNSFNADLREFYIIDENDNVIYEKNSEFTGKNLNNIGEKGSRILKALKSSAVEENNSENVILTSFKADDGSHRIILGIDSTESGTEHIKLMQKLGLLRC